MDRRVQTNYYDGNPSSAVITNAQSNLDWITVAVVVTVTAIIIPAIIFLLKKYKTFDGGDPESSLADEHSIPEASCLGRPFKVGMLYNTCKDSLLTKKMLWNDDTIKKATNTADEEEETCNYEVISNDTLATKVGQLGIETDLSLSVVSGLVDISKSAEYLTDIRTSSRQARVVLKCQRFTKTDKLIMNKRAKFTDPKLLTDGTATHVVVGIKYGSEAFFVFDREVSDDEDYDSARKELESLVDNIPNYAKGKGRASKEETLLSSKLQYQVHSDQPVTQTLSTLNDVITIYKRFLNDSRTEVPKVAWLYPLHLLDKGAPTVFPIEDPLIMKTLKVLDSLNTFAIKANSLVRHSRVCKCFPSIRQQLEQYYTSLEEQETSLKKELTSLLPKIRKSECMDDLKHLITDSQEQTHSHEKWFHDKRKEVKFLSQSIRKLNSIDITTTSQQFESFKKRIGGRCRIISLEFQVSQESKFTLNTEKSWCDSTDLTSKVTEKIKRFTSLVNSSEDVDKKFVVVTFSKKKYRSSHIGVAFFLYKPGNQTPEEIDLSDQVFADDKNDDDLQSSSPEESDGNDTNDEESSLPPLVLPLGPRLVEKVMGDPELSQKTISTSSSFTMYKLQTKLVLNDATNKIAKCEFGESSSIKPTKVVMVMGATGAGKSTLINGMVNYILGVKFEDHFRFKLICDETAKSQSHSQTDDITAYTLYWQEGFTVPYNVTIIDTPGFGDTRGIERDNQISKQVKELFTIKGKQGIDQIHAVGFVTQSALARLTPTQRYIFDSILSIFGKDIQNNIFIMATFADSAKPAVLDALKAANLPHENLFSFNNSGLFTSSDKSYFSKSFWDMGISSFRTFFSKLNQLKTVSLSLTREVLEEREKLETVLNSVQPKMREGLSKIETLRQEETILKGKESEILQNKDFDYEVDVTKQNKVDLPKGTFVTNCLICNFTCHYPCGIQSDDHKYRCAAMDTYDPETARCRICPHKCGWRDHHNNPYYFEIYYEKETRSSKDLKERYNLASAGKIDIETIMQNVHEELDDLSKKVLKEIREARRCIQRLGEIALKPNPMTEVEYIELLITSENEEQKPGYQDRVKSFEKMKQNAQLMTHMTDEQFHKSLKEEQGTENKKKWWQFWVF